MVDQVRCNGVILVLPSLTRTANRQKKVLVPEPNRIGLVQTASLFTRGSESVRIVRVRHRTGEQTLKVEGPGPDTESHDFRDVMDSAHYESELERRLVAKGFRLEQFAGGNRRSGGDRRATPRGYDRRHHLERVV